MSADIGLAVTEKLLGVGAARDGPKPRGVPMEQLVAWLSWAPDCEVRSAVQKMANKETTPVESTQAESYRLRSIEEGQNFSRIRRDDEWWW